MKSSIHQVEHGQDEDLSPPSGKLQVPYMTPTVHPPMRTLAVSPTPFLHTDIELHSTSWRISESASGLDLSSTNNVLSPSQHLYRPALRKIEGWLQHRSRVVPNKSSILSCYLIRLTTFNLPVHGVYFQMEIHHLPFHHLSCLISVPLPLMLWYLTPDLALYYFNFIYFTSLLFTDSLLVLARFGFFSRT
jgi:hypothetical protein